MTSPPPKTFDEHLHYLHESVKLHLFFLWTWLRRHPDEGFVHALRNRVDIYRRTDINEGFANHKTRRFDDPRWLDLEQGLGRLHEECRNDPSPARFEAEGFALVRPLVDARAPRDYAEPPEAVAFKYRCGSLDYDPPTPQQPRRVFLHIANAVTPRSIFDDPRYLAGCFHNLMRQCRDKCNADSLETVTWLNSYPRWLACFPPAWRDRLGPELEEVDPGFGYWGQFLTARGTFNVKYGRLLRETGRLPYYPRHSWCGFDDLARHLALGASGRGSGEFQAIRG